MPFALEGILRTTRSRQTACPYEMAVAICDDAPVFFDPPVFSIERGTE
jgi:hypothetical protein